MADEHADTMNKALFLNMVMMFSTSAMQQLGKIVNPATGKTAVDLQGAQFFIDLLSMLKAKTANNLDREEARLLNDTLATLQMNYVETAAETGKPEDASAPASEEAAPTDPATGQTPPPSTEAQPEGKTDKKDPRFRKSYG
jgi:hypothetical protein